jgi:tRNA pseudouridine13 synthase
MSDVPAWPRGSTLPRPTALIKSAPEDFRVVEIPRFIPEGRGTHLWLEIEKRGLNTEWVARQLASLAGVPLRDVGYAGMKDRHAVTRQWFSLACQEAADTDWTSWDIEGVRILSADWHPRKLQRGTLKGNRFTIVLREVSGDVSALEESLRRVAAGGVPNYFGPQRFGRHGANLERARTGINGRRRLPRNKRSLYLSVARSFLFNEVLAERVRQGCWNRLLPGDVVILDGRQSAFVCSLPDDLMEARCAAGEVHPAGCLWGEGGLSSEGAAADLEQRALAGHEDWRGGLRAHRVKKAWRSFRLLPRDLQWEWHGDVLELRFELPAGAYATTLLEELVSISDASISESG